MYTEEDRLYHKQKSHEHYLANKESYKQKHRINKKIYVKRNVEYVNTHKLQSGCQACGYNEHAEALDLHHFTDDKEMEVSKMAVRAHAIERIQAEIAKCIVLCAICHRLHHHGKLSLTTDDVERRKGHPEHT